MTALEIIIFFLVVWWPVFFILLPIGFEQLEQTDNRFAKSAPKKPLVLKKFLFTTFFSIIITFIFWLLSYLEIFTLKSLII